MATVLSSRPGGSGGGGGAPSGPAGGDLAGTYPDPTIAPNSVAAAEIDGTDAAAIRTELGVPSNTEAVLDSIIDAKGDILAGTAADTIARVAVGATNGMVLEVASGATPGMQWDLPPGWEYAYAEKTTDTSITATTEATADVVVTSGAVVLDGSTAIFVQSFSPEAINPSAVGMGLVLFGALNGGAAASLGFYGSLNISTASTAEIITIPVALNRRLTPAAGSWVYSFRAFVTSGTGTIRGGIGGPAAYVSTFIRVTKV